MPKKKTSLLRRGFGGRAKKTKKPQIIKAVKKLETKVTKLLDEAKVKYKTISHKVVYTAHDTAQTTKKRLSEIDKEV